MRLLPIERHGHLLFAGSEGLPSSARPSPRAGGNESRFRALANQVALELGERPKDVKHQTAARRRRIDRFLKALEADARLFQLGQKLDQMLERAAESVEPPHYQHVIGT